MDAITLLKDDHKTVEHLFKRFEKAGERAYVEKREIVDQIIEALAVHAAIEEQLFYPVARATVPKTEDLVLESLEEHHIVKWVLSELEGMDPREERFDAKVTVLIENVRHHVEEEETDLFPLVRDDLGRKALGELGDAMQAAKKVAPTHPHPRSPDTPPGNRVLGTSVAAADRIEDKVSGLLQGGVIALGDLIATIRGHKTSQASPRGSKTTRRVAGEVRTRASHATRSATTKTRHAKATGSNTARAAASGGRSTVRAAKVGTKGAATSARTSTKLVAATARRASTTTGRSAHKAVARTAATAKRSARKTSTATSR